MNSQYSGTEIRDLHALVDTTLAIHGSGLRFLDHAEAVLRGYMPPEMFLADALGHLADKRMDTGDQEAWWKIKGVQECLFSGLTRICACCGRMEGDHGNFTNLCPDAKGTFASSLPICGAILAQNSEDAYGQRCRRKALAGSEFCQEHQSQ